MHYDLLMSLDLEGITQIDRRSEQLQLLATPQSTIEPALCRDPLGQTCESEVPTFRALRLDDCGEVVRMTRMGADAAAGFVALIAAFVFISHDQAWDICRVLSVMHCGGSRHGWFRGDCSYANHTKRYVSSSTLSNQSVILLTWTNSSHLSFQDGTSIHFSHVSCNSSAVFHSQMPNR